jgi:hypothetical protein
MLGKVLALSTLLSVVLISTILQSTSPSTIHPLGILVIFVLFYVLALGVLTFLLKIIFTLVSNAQKKTPASLSLQQSYYYASVLALAPVMIIGARSIGRSGGYDIALIVIFELIACFYISKR